MSSYFKTNFNKTQVLPTNSAQAAQAKARESTVKIKTKLRYGNRQQVEVPFTLKYYSGPWPPSCECSKLFKAIAPDPISNTNPIVNTIKKIIPIVNPKVET